jgi:hypothetical protein
VIYLNYSLGCSAEKPSPLKEEASPVRRFDVDPSVLVSDSLKNAF